MIKADSFAGTGAGGSARESAQSSYEGPVKKGLQIGQGLKRQGTGRRHTKNLGRIQRPCYRPFEDLTSW